jgi:hypothetical protein
MTRRPAYAVSGDVAWVDSESIGGPPAQVFLALLPDQPPRVLSGPAWAIWTAVSETDGTLDEIVSATAALTEQEPTAVRQDIEAFLEALVSQGLLVSAGPA